MSFKFCSTYSNAIRVCFVKKTNLISKILKLKLSELRTQGDQLDKCIL